MLGTAVLFTVATFAGMLNFDGNKVASARDFDAEIKALENQIKDYQSRASDLSKKADTLNGKISELQNQQAEIQAQIDLSTAKRKQLEQQIADNEAKIKKQTEALSQNLQDQYYSNQTSSLDILMNSNSVSDYVDQQTRQQAMSDQITQTVKEVKQLKTDLEKQKKDVEVVIGQQKSQKQDLADSQAEQKKLLDETQGQEAKFKELTAQTEAQKKKVQEEQQAAIRAYRAANASGSGKIIVNNQCGGGYPFCHATPDTTQTSGGFTTYGNARECVSYVQWRIFRIGGTNRRGNAGSWAAYANSSAKENTVAIIGYGRLPYGHVAWVEQVGTGSHAGEVYVSEYNWNAYSYTERWVPISSFTGGFYDPLK